MKHTAEQELAIIKASPFFLKLNGELTAEIMVAQIEACAALCTQRLKAK